MRTEQWCRSHGLDYTGISSRSLHEIQVELDILRSNGYEAHISQWRRNPLDRGCGTGYSIYADKKWFLDESIASLKKDLENIPKRQQTALEEFNKTMSDLENRRQVISERLSQLEGQRSELLKL